MSPRAACRLATLGFQEIYDYPPGKVDWIAHGLDLEGEWQRSTAVGAFLRRDAATCRPHEPATLVAERIEASPYRFALVLSDHDVLLGRVDASALHQARGESIHEMMDPGPSTVRPHIDAAQLARRLTDRDQHTMIVTTPDGRLLGVVKREDLERR